MEKRQIISKLLMRSLHTILTIVVALFFISKGYNKLNSDKLKPVELDQIITTIIDNNSYEAPVGYNIVMNTFKYSGFLDMISIIQILLGILILIPITRFIGLLTLLPVIFNIFFMHVFFDNRMDENIETGILLLINIILLLYYHNLFKHALLTKE